LLLPIVLRLLQARRVAKCLTYYHPHAHLQPYDKMAVDTVAPIGISVQLPADVYQEQFEFVELVRDVIDSIDSQTPDDIVHSQVELLLAIIGRDLLKLHALVEAVNAKIETRSSWATTAAVKFYR
jgi:hypothetical protein